MLLKYKSSISGVGILKARPFSGPIFGTHRKANPSTFVKNPGW